MSYPVDIRPDHLEKVQKILREHLPAGVAIWVFGSRADWSTKDSSDLDLALEGDGRLSNKMLSGLKWAFEESSLPYTVDVVDINRIGDSFRAILESQMVRLHLDDDPSSERYRIEDPQSGGTGDVDAKNRAGLHWQHRATLSNLIDLQLSSVDKKSKPGERAVQLCNYMDVYNNSFIHSGIDFLRATATDREISNCSLAVGDVVITKDSEKYDDIGVPALVRDDVPDLVCGYHLAILRPRNSVVDGSYLFYALRTSQAQSQFHSFANGITRFGLRKSDIGLVEIPVPPLAAQREIAHVLCALDKKIELNRRMNQTLEAMARALFKSWFVEFVPVRAKMDRRWRRGESLPGLPAKLYDLFPDRLVESEFGEIPEGWAHNSVYSFADIVYGAPFASKSFNSGNEGVPLIRIRDLATHDPSVSTREVHQQGHLINPGDIVVGMDGAFRLEVWKGPNSWLNQRVCHFEPKPGVPTSFLAGALMDPLAFFERAKVGTTVIHLGKKDLETIRLLRPKQMVLDSFANTAEPLLQKAVASIRESRTLSALRDTLLPKLISGEIRVSEVERAAEIVG